MRSALDLCRLHAAEIHDALGDLESSAEEMFHLAQQAIRAGDESSGEAYAELSENLIAFFGPLKGKMLETFTADGGA